MKFSLFVPERERERERESKQAILSHQAMEVGQ